MQFTPTAQFLAFARGAIKSLIWKVFVRKTATLGAALDTTDWLEVTHFVHTESMQVQKSSIEYEYGMFVSDSVSFVVSDIEWWKSHVFNATESEYIECKIQCQLAAWGITAPDIAYTFSGIIDKQYQPRESSDTITITAYTAQDIGQQISADYLTTQYLNSSETMLVLQNIPGLYVKNAAVAGKELNVGTHRINYRTKLVTQGYPASNELIENGTFDNDLGWALGNGWSISGNKAHCDTGVASELRQYVRLDAGATYKVTFTLSNVTAGAIRPILQGTLGTSRTTNGTFTENIVAGSTGTMGLAFRTTANSFVGKVSAVSLTRVNTQVQVLVREAQLDDGRWVELAVGDNTLGNGASEDSDTERLVVHIDDLNEVPPRNPPRPNEPFELERSDAIVVITKGDTLPRQWYANAGAQFILSEILNRLGITQQTFDTLEMPTATGARKISFVDNPPNGSVTGTKYALLTVGNDLWVTVGHRLYKRSAGVYTLMATLSPGDVISKLMYNQRNGHIWIFYGANANGNGKLRRYVIATSTLSSEIVLSSTADKTRHMSIELVDYEYEADAFMYAVVYTVTTNGLNGGTISQVNGNTLAVSTIFTGLNLGYPDNFGITSQFMHQLSGGKVRFRTNNGINPYYHEIQVDVTGAWQDNGQQFQVAYDYDTAAFVASENRIYAWNPVERQIESHTTSSGTRTINLLDVSSSAAIGAMRALNNKVYFTLYDVDPLIAGRYFYFYEFSNNEVHNFQDYPEKSNAAAALFTALTNVGNRIYGIDFEGRLFQFDSMIALYAPRIETTGKTLTDIWNDVLKSFLLCGTISPAKRAHIYRRVNADGLPQTSGQSVSLTVDDATDIIIDELLYRKRNFIDVSNETVRFTFDGIDYNIEALDDVPRFTLTSKLIPDEIVQDLAFNAYQFFKTNRSLYRIPIGMMPLLQYEPFDGAQVTFTTTKLKKMASGLIMGIEISIDGAMTFSILLPS
jgi:hypothetical protein